MNILMWNCRGADNQDFIHAFKDMIAYHKPTIVILTETKLAGSRALSTVETLGFPNHAHTDAKGNSGGIFVLWTNDILGEILISTRQEIHMRCKVSLSSLPFILSAIYSLPYKDYRKVLWDNIVNFGTRHNLPWVVTGDFNLILNVDEKHGGRPPFS